MPNFGRSQGCSQPRRSGGVPTSGRWARGWVRTNVSHSAAGVRGSRPPDFFCIFLIQNPAFWCILWLRKWTISVFLSRPYALRKGRLLEEAAEWGPKGRKSRPKAEIGVGFLGRGSKPHQLGVWQWCKQDQILTTKTKTKITRPRPRPPEVNKGTWRI